MRRARPAISLRVAPSRSGRRRGAGRYRVRALALHPAVTPITIPAETLTARPNGCSVARISEVNRHMSSVTAARRCRPIVLLACLLTCGCNLWIAPAPQSDELARGLVVMYPGALNTEIEMIGYYIALRAAGIDRAIEVVAWAPFLTFFDDPSGFPEVLKPWAQAEALRLAEYQDAHPDCPITLLGYSAGTLAASVVAEQMPDGYAVDRVIMMSPGMKSNHDLTPMLDRTRNGAVVYWSMRDGFTAYSFGMFIADDPGWARPAATFGFDMQDSRLLQVAWDESMTRYLNFGEHFDAYLNIPWLQDYLAPWVSSSTPAE